MNYGETAPAVDKVLHADGSVTTKAGGVILPADLNRAREFQNRSAAADKWLHPDGSVTDSEGRVILDADESRARDYAGRIPQTGFKPGERIIAAPAHRLSDVSVSAALLPHEKLGEMAEPAILMKDFFQFADAAGAAVK